MKAIQIDNSHQPQTLAAVDLPIPGPGEKEILVRVSAAGVTPAELVWYPTTNTRSGEPRVKAVPGHEFSGVVAALGKNAQGFEVGDEIYGLNDWFADGATAEFCITQPQNIAAKPQTLSHAEAAAVPIGALTAWQGLYSRVDLQPGERVLIHGAAGAVGVFATQFARLRGAVVIATASAQAVAFVRQIGADEVIDYKSERFEDRVDKVDVVFDAVGGETRDRSWSVLRPGGRLVTIAADAEATNDQRVKDAFLLVEANQHQLQEIARLLDAGTIRAFVRAEVSMEQTPLAYTGGLRERLVYGKVVVNIQ
ncbi:MAG TPA: NADP-dependent oxidoreductase [Terracidiphilus sp.]|nr:NADP-dependent oxidoreductase [Terracidiphilus sp.]